MYKHESRWCTGVWLGFRLESGEILIGTEKGVIKVRSVRRKGNEKDRWDAQVFNKCIRRWRKNEGLEMFFPPLDLSKVCFGVLGGGRSKEDYLTSGRWILLPFLRFIRSLRYLRFCCVCLPLLIL